jgi:hypothetical protein
VKLWQLRHSWLSFGLHARPLVPASSPRLALNFSGVSMLPSILWKHLVARLDLADDLGHPLLGHVAVGAGGAHAGAVLVVDGVAVLDVDVVLHLVARDAEGLAVGPFHGGVEAAPEDDAQHEGDAEAAGGHRPHPHTRRRTGPRLRAAGACCCSVMPWLRPYCIRGRAGRCSPPAAWRRSAARGTGCRSSAAG